MPRWLKIIVAAVVIPVALLIGLELVLRLADYGHPTRVFVPVSVQGRPSWTMNPAIAARFFANVSFAEKFKPQPDIFPQVKGSNTFRIFVFGESAARGMFYEPFAFGYVLREMLAHACPGMDFEIVNTGINAIDSWVVREFVKEACACEPDLFIFYCGNNEIIGPFGPASLSTTWGADSRLVGNLRIWLSSLRINQLAVDVRAALAPISQAELKDKWHAIQIQQRIRHDDPRCERAAQEFVHNMQDMHALAAAHEVPVIVCTLAANVGDFPPVGPMVDPTLGAVDADTVTALVRRAQAHVNTNAYDAAEAVLEEAARLDPDHADVLFLQGMCREALGDMPTAARSFTRAALCDGNATRAGVRLNPYLRAAWGTAAPPNVVLCDAEHALGTYAPAGIIGSESIFDHVHLNIVGHYLVASTLFHSVGAFLPCASAAAAPLSAEACLTRLGCNKWDVGRAYHETAQFLLGNAILSNHLNYSRWCADVRTLYSPFLARENWSHDADLLREAVQACTNALIAAPDSWDLLRRLAQAQLLRGQYDDALAAAERAYAVNPFCEVDQIIPDVHKQRAEQRVAAGDLDGAVQDLDAAIGVLRASGTSINLARACALRANVLLKQGKFAAVIRDLDEALRLEPGNAQWYNARGFAHFQRDQYPQAVADYTRSLDAQSLQGQVHYNRAYAYAKLEQYEKAAADVTAALRLDYPVEPQFVKFLKAKELELKQK